MPRLFFQIARLEYQLWMLFDNPPKEMLAEGNPGSLPERTKMLALINDFRYIDCFWLLLSS